MDFQSAVLIMPILIMPAAAPLAFPVIEIHGSVTKHWEKQICPFGNVDCFLTRRKRGKAFHRIVLNVQVTLL